MAQVTPGSRAGPEIQRGLTGPLRPASDAVVVTIDHWPEFRAPRRAAVTGHAAHSARDLPGPVLAVPKGRHPLRIPTLLGLRLLATAGCPPDLDYVDAEHNHRVVLSELEESPGSSPWQPWWATTTPPARAGGGGRVRPPARPRGRAASNRWRLIRPDDAEAR